MGPRAEPLTSLLVDGLPHEALVTSHRARRKRATSQPSAASFFVSHLPGLPSDSRLRLYAGHLPASDPQTQAASDAWLFFVLSAAKHIADRPRLVIWLNGGSEIGPVRMAPGSSSKLVEAPASWSSYANVLFIDQPAGTGFSYLAGGTPVAELAPAAEQVVAFLLNFFRTFPEYSTMDTYLAGESYAGQYLPYLADAMLKSKLITSSLRGVLMGNAWIHPKVQYPAYLDFSKLNDLIDATQIKKADAAMAKCAAKLNSTEGERLMINECEALVWASVPPPDKDNQCINLYNVHVKQRCGTDYPADAARAIPYLQSASTVKALHAGGKGVPFQQCNDTVGAQFVAPASRPSVELLPGLIERGVDVLLFAGMWDMMCNWLGIERSIDQMTWGGKTGLNVTADDWFVNGTHAGSWASDRGLSWVKIANASHMVPIEQPFAAHDMFLRFAKVDTLQAAGDAARIPSSVGTEGQLVVGQTRPDGTALHPVEPALSDATGPLPLVNGKSRANLTDAALEQQRALVYGPRRTAVLSSLLLAALVGVWLFFRWRRRARYQRGGAVELEKQAPEEEGGGETSPLVGKSPLMDGDARVHL